MLSARPGWFGCWCLLLVLLASCSGTSGDKSKDAQTRRGTATTDDEAYILPPLSEFEPFPEEIFTDLVAKCATENFTLLELRRTKGARRQSIYAAFGGDASQADSRPTVQAAMNLLGRNFNDVARLVLAFPGAAGSRYFVVPGSRLGQHLGLNLRSGDRTITEDELWRTVEYEITPENPVEAPTAGKDSYEAR